MLGKLISALNPRNWANPADRFDTSDPEASKLPHDGGAVYSIAGSSGDRRPSLIDPPTMVWVRTRKSGAVVTSAAEFRRAFPDAPPIAVADAELFFEYGGIALQVIPIQ